MARGKRRPEPCPDEERHTPGPSGYVAWHLWAEEMAQTHKQKRCPGCGLFQIWEPLPTTQRGRNA